MGAKQKNESLANLRKIDRDDRRLGRYLNGFYCAAALGIAATAYMIFTAFPDLLTTRQIRVYENLDSAQGCITKVVYKDDQVYQFSLHDKLDNSVTARDYDRNGGIDYMTAFITDPLNDILDEIHDQPYGSKP